MQTAKLIILPVLQHGIFSCFLTAVQQLIFKSGENSGAALSKIFSPKQQEQSILSALHIPTKVILGIFEELP